MHLDPNIFIIKEGGQHITLSYCSFILLFVILYGKFLEDNCLTMLC